MPRRMNVFPRCELHHNLAGSSGLLYEMPGSAAHLGLSTDMDLEIRPCASADEVRHAVAPIRYYFGRSAPNEDQAGRITRVLPAERMYAAWEGSRAVGGLGAFPFQLTVPGGRVPAAGVTVAAVLPTHRRRGVLRSPCGRRGPQPTLAVDRTGS